jgi:hypothetical protein
MLKIIGGLVGALGTLATLITIWTFWDDIAPKIVQFRPTSNSYQAVPDKKDTYTCVSPCGAAQLEWHVKGRRTQVFLEDKPVDPDGEQFFDSGASRTFNLRVKGLVHDDFRTVTIIINSPTPTPTPTPTPSPSTPTPSPTPSSLHSVAILYPKVGPIYTKNQVSAQVASQIAGFFRAHNYDLSPAPEGIHSLDQYVSVSRNAKTLGADWVVQAEVEMKPTYQHKNTGGVSPNHLLPDGPGAVVDLTMNCSVTIRMLHLPLGDHPGTGVGQSKVARTVSMTMMTPTVRDPEFSRSAAEKATTDALANLRIEK